MSKYIVKNCPSCMKDTACFSTGTFNKSFQLNGFYKCENIADCPIKQVVELCKQISDHAKWCNCLDNPGAPLANKILQTLDVQEVE